MKRHAAKHRPKHVRRLLAKFADAGYADVTVEVGRRGYLLSWQADGAPMRIGLGLSGVGDSVERLWSAVRALFRARGLEVPA